jgi:hypothetical protein
MAQLRAVFVTTNGIPTFAEGVKYKHYSIMLSITDPPVDMLSVIYQLDNTYANPIRIVTKGVPNFQESITSYGDFDVRVSYRPMRDPNRIQTLLTRRLSDALAASYEPVIPEAVSSAIKDITDH